MCGPGGEPCSASDVSDPARVLAIDALAAFNHHLAPWHPKYYH